LADVGIHLKDKPLNDESRAEAKKAKRAKTTKPLSFSSFLPFLLQPLPSPAESSGEMSPDINGLGGN
jgi:hypothetical protein